MKFSGNVDHGPVSYGGDLNYFLDPGIFKGFFIIALITSIGGVGSWWRFINHSFGEF